jgi:hypothetical protein
MNDGVLAGSAEQSTITTVSDRSSARAAVSSRGWCRLDTSGVTPVSRSIGCESPCSPRERAGRLTPCRRRGSGTLLSRWKLTEADRLLAQGADTAEVARQLGVSEQTYFRWRDQFGALKAEDAKRLKELEKENARL